MLFGKHHFYFVVRCRRIEEMTIEREKVKINKPQFMTENNLYETDKFFFHQNLRNCVFVSITTNLKKTFINGENYVK